MATKKAAKTSRKAKPSASPSRAAEIGRAHV